MEWKSQCWEQRLFIYIYKIKIPSMGLQARACRGPLMLKGGKCSVWPSRMGDRAETMIKLLEVMPSTWDLSKETRKSWCHQDKWTEAAEQMQEKQQIERILKHSKPTSKEPRTSTETWVHSLSIVACSKSAGPRSLQALAMRQHPGAGGQTTCGFFGIFPETHFYIPKHLLPGPRLLKLCPCILELDESKSVWLGL